MTPYTDIQLKQTLAKMLPTEVYWECREGFSEPHLRWFYGITQKEPVHNTELLHLCWLVESTSEEAASIRYAELLAMDLDIIDCGYYPGEGTINLSAIYNVLHATWQQRTIALAKVKGIEII